MAVHNEHLHSRIVDLVELARHAGFERTLEFQLHVLRLQCDQAAQYQNESLARKVLRDADALRERIEKGSAFSARAVHAA